MRKISNDELKRILDNHMHWLQRDVDGWDEMIAVLRNTDLRGVNLNGADLRYIRLNGSDLRGVDLDDANLRYANLRYANLINANLSNTDLSNANLKYADLSNTDLSYANLRYANLRYANLSDADLSGANIDNTTIMPDIPLVCPETGSFIGYKKTHGLIVELEIPEDAKRSSGTSRKCRCSKAKILNIQDIDGNVADVNEVASDWSTKFVYRVGETVEVPDFDDNRWHGCSSGIHFFMTREEAVEYECI